MRSRVEAEVRCTVSIVHPSVVEINTTEGILRMLPPEATQDLPDRQPDPYLYRYLAETRHTVTQPAMSRTEDAVAADYHYRFTSSYCAHATQHG